jgi:NAD(P)-dependent dehydrogenase (short-subunit alcohol dehydrogenase family)
MREMPKSKVVLVTGAGGNLGRAVSRGLVGAYSLALADLHLDADNAALSARPNVAAFEADLMQPSEARRVVHDVVGRSGRIDAVCNLVGGFASGTAVHETSLETWERVLSLNLKPILNVSAAAVPYMSERRAGAIINIGAGVAQKGLARMGAYIASKSAVQRITESMSAELRESNINVNCLLPGAMDTPENRDAMPGNKQLIDLDGIAHVIRFLISDDARVINGACINLA